jgi:hypothetical protein
MEGAPAPRSRPRSADQCASHPDPTRYRPPARARKADDWEYAVRIDSSRAALRCRPRTFRAVPRVLCIASAVLTLTSRGAMRKHRTIASRSKIAVVVASAAVVIASCGSARTVVVPSPQQPIAPGHDSPQSAVAGYLTGYAKNDGKTICEYVAPTQDSICKFLVGDSPHSSLSRWRIGNSAVRGSKAIVAVLAHRWCIAKFCLSNDDPSKGLPKKSRNFERAFAATSNSLPALSLVRVADKWYVVLA